MIEERIREVGYVADEALEKVIYLKEEVDTLKNRLEELIGIFKEADIKGISFL